MLKLSLLAFHARQLLCEILKHAVTLEARFVCKPLQGVSGAGNQLGLADSRSGLVSQPFRVFDELPEA